MLIGFLFGILVVIEFYLAYEIAERMCKAYPGKATVAWSWLVGWIGGGVAGALLSAAYFWVAVTVFGVEFYPKLLDRMISGVLFGTLFGAIAGTVAGRRKAKPAVSTPQEAHGAPTTVSASAPTSVVASAPSVASASEPLVFPTLDWGDVQNAEPVEAAPIEAVKATTDLPSDAPEREGTFLGWLTGPVSDRDAFLIGLVVTIAIFTLLAIGFMVARI